MRVGIGDDIHKLVKGRRLILGGVAIPHPQGLKGHSDADVLVHAVCDALLGAAASGDIGKHFPDTDPAYEGISSLKILEQTNSIIASQGLSVANIDSVIVIEKPGLASYIDKMRQNIAGTLGIPPDTVSVKATTHEKVGEIGRGEAVAALATVLLHSA